MSTAEPKLERTLYFHGGPSTASQPGDNGRPLELECGSRLESFTIAYQTYGTLNANKSNAILICHALTGDSHVGGQHEEDNRRGWWDIMVGPGKAFDSDKYFIICSNVLGGCKGSSGPMSTNPATGQPYGLRFPFITVEDMVRAQRRLIWHFGIGKLLAVVGGSMGGMQALSWAQLFPDAIAAAIPIATAGKHTAQNIAWNEIGRRAIINDPCWNNGDYYGEGQEPPRGGLAIGRMIGHVTYLSEQIMEEKFGRRLQEKSNFGYDFGVDFQIESYLDHQGEVFWKRFDANSYLYVTKALDYFDFAGITGSYRGAFQETAARFLFLSYSSDWLYPPRQNEELAEAARDAGRSVEYHEIDTHLGHDAFLIRAEPQTKIVKKFLAQFG